MGRIVTEHKATLDRFAGDGILIFLNDPFPIPDPALRAARMAIAMRDSLERLKPRWAKLGYELDLGVGLAQGYATLGAFGFEGRWDYTAVGGVVNLASRLCGAAEPGQILIDRRAWAALDERAEVDAIGPLQLKGYAKPVPAYALKRMID
jgi:class 3 adenylate cyclase